MLDMTGRMLLMKKYKNKLALLLIFCLVILMMPVAGCSDKSKKESKGNMYLYYADKDQTKLVTSKYTSKYSKTEDVIDDMLKQMNKTSSKINVVTAKPENVKIIKYGLTDGILTIDFDSSYQRMGKVTELLCRSAIVLTMTQISGINYVSFTINDQPLMDSYSNPIGSMKAADFVDSSNSNINSYQDIDVVLYFANSDGKKLVATNYSGICQKNTSQEKFIIEKLIKGPSQSKYKRTVPSDLKLISVFSKDGTCYVNFDSSFLTEPVEVSQKLEIYSIVNSLVELSYINNVQISINGETNKKMTDNISLDQTFSRNLDLVE